MAMERGHVATLACTALETKPRLPDVTSGRGGEAVKSPHRAREPKAARAQSSPRGYPSPAGSRVAEDHIDGRFPAPA